MAILERVVDPKRGDLTPELAQFILSLDFGTEDQARYAMLASKAQEGTLSTAEQDELDDFLNVNDFLSVVQAKARASLQGKNSAA